MATKRKILFVYTGNLDRSPTAERIYKNRENLELKSAGTSISANSELFGNFYNGSFYCMGIKPIGNNYWWIWCRSRKLNLFLFF